MNQIKEYKEKTLIILKNWKTLTTEKTVKEMFDRIKDNSHVMVEWEIVNKYMIENIVPLEMDDVDVLIEMQSKEIKQKMRAKRLWLKNELCKEMSLEYAKNYLASIT